jgi:hypothetical protein
MRGKGEIEYFQQLGGQKKSLWGVVIENKNPQDPHVCYVIQAGS